MGMGPFRDADPTAKGSEELYVHDVVTMHSVPEKESGEMKFYLNSPISSVGAG